MLKLFINNLKNYIMKNYLLIIGLLFVFSCNTSDNSKLLALNTTTETNAPTEKVFYTYEDMVIAKPMGCMSPYTLDYKITKKTANTFELEIDMDLNGNAHFVSPNSKIAYKGRFTLDINVDENIELVGDLIETPLSKEEIDNHPFVRGPINWVRVDTNYKQQLKLNTDEDFFVIGFIQFTIEPRCTLERIPIKIEYKNGKMMVERFEC